MVANIHKWLRMITNCRKWLQTVPNSSGCELSQMVANSRKQSEMVANSHPKTHSSEDYASLEYSIMAPLDRRGGSPLTASYSKYFYLFIYVLPELKRIYLCYKKKLGGLPGT